MSRANIILCSIACLVLMLGGMGSQCPGSSTSATFKSTDIPASNAATTVKSWQTPVFMDLAATASTAFTNQNYNLSTGGTTFYPMAVLNYGVQKFQVLLNHECDTGNNANAICVGGAMGDGDVYGYIFQPYSFLGTWVSGLSNYIPFGTLNVSIDYSRNVSAMKAVVDSQNNVTALSHVTTDDGDGFLTVQNYSNDNSYWTAVNYTQAATLFRSTTDTYRPNSTAMAVVPSTNQVVIESCRTDNAAFHAIHSPHSTWSSLTTDWTNCSDFGLDMGFDKNGRGVLAFTSDTNDTVYVKRWQSGGWTAPVTDVSVGSFDIMPTVFVDPNFTVLGHSSVFLYRAASHLGVASLGRVSCTYSACTVDPTDIDNGIGTGGVYTNDGTNFMKPVLAQNGSNAALFFIKSDGVVGNAVWYTRYQGSGTWGAVQSLQDAVSISHIATWVSASMNSSGQIAVVYSAYDSTAALEERVYGTIYSNGSWSTTIRLDDMANLNRATSPAVGYYMPSVSIDESGNAVATFSMEDNTTACGAGNCRRAIAVSYR